MIELGMIRDIVTIFGVIAGFSYYVMTVRNSQRIQKMQLETRQAGLFMQLFSIYDTKEFLEDFGKIAYHVEYEDLADWESKYGPLTELSSYSSWVRVGRFFDGVGILVKKELIDAYLVTELLRELVINSWESMRAWVTEIREIMGTPEVWENFEYLYGEVRKRHPDMITLDDTMIKLKEMVGSEQGLN